MGWLKDILQENRRVVNSWPEWKRRAGMSELDGMAAINQTVTTQQWPPTVDAMVWAEEYCKTFPGAEKMTMVGWFANAIMAGFDTAGMRCSGEIQQLQAENAQLKADLAQCQKDLARCRQVSYRAGLEAAVNETDTCEGDIDFLKYKLDAKLKEQP